MKQFITNKSKAWLTELNKGLTQWIKSSTGLTFDDANYDALAKKEKLQQQYQLVRPKVSF